jgi:hypothetical protein
VNGAARPLHRLDTLRKRRADIEIAVMQAVEAARAAGASWSAVGTALGVSAQAAQQRYGGRLRLPTSSRHVVAPRDGGARRQAAPGITVRARKVSGNRKTSRHSAVVSKTIDQRRLMTRSEPAGTGRPAISKDRQS